jgi:hypothetical protein
VDSELLGSKLRGVVVTGSTVASRSATSWSLVGAGSPPVSLRCPLVPSGQESHWQRLPVRAMQSVASSRGGQCRFHSFSDGHQAIVDVYLSGDIIGLDAISRIRSLEGVITLTSTVTETIDGEQALAIAATWRSVRRCCRQPNDVSAIDRHTIRSARRREWVKVPHSRPSRQRKQATGSGGKRCSSHALVSHGIS